MEGVPGAEVAVVDRPACAKLGVALSEKGEAGDHLALANGNFAEGFWEVDLHGVVVVHGISIVRWERDDEALGLAAGFDYPGDFTDVGDGGVESEVSRRGGFEEPDFDGAGASEGNVVVGEPPFPGLRTGDRWAGGDLGGFSPSRI